MLEIERLPPQPKNNAPAPRRAQVTAVYRVHRHGRSGPPDHAVAVSLAEAIALLRGGTGPSSMEVHYRWRMEGKKGEGRVRYLGEASFPAATEHFLRGTIRGMIARSVADAIAAGPFDTA